MRWQLVAGALVCGLIVLLVAGLMKANRDARAIYADLVRHDEQPDDAA